MKKTLRASLAALCVFVLFLTPVFAQTTKIQRSFINESFEIPHFRNLNCYEYLPDTQVPGWSTTHLVAKTYAGCGTNAISSTGHLIEIWANGQGKKYAQDGTQFAEINATQPSRLYQTVCLTQGEQFHYQFYHRFTKSTDETARFDITPGNDPDGTPIEIITTSQATADWSLREGTHTYNGTTGLVTIGFRSLQEGSSGNLLDAIQIGPLKPMLEFGTTSGEGPESSNGINMPTIKLSGQLENALPVTITVSSDIAKYGVDYDTPKYTGTVNPDGSYTYNFTIDPGNYDGSQDIPIGINILDNQIIEPTKVLNLDIVFVPDKYTLSSITTCGGTAKAKATYSILNDDAGIALSKQLSADRTLADDQFQLSITGPNSDSVTTTGTGQEATGIATITSVSVGQPYTLSETMSDGSQIYAYSTTYSCTNSVTNSSTAIPTNGSGQTFQITPQTGDAITCTFINTPLQQSLSIEKKGTPPAKPAVGETIAYEFTIENTGQVQLNNITIQDDKVDAPAICQKNSLSPGETTICTASYSLTQNDVDSGIVNNTASVSGVNQSNNIIQSDPIEVDTYFDPFPSLTIEKTGKIINDNGNGIVDYGETIEYTFTVINSGPVTLKNITVNDPIIEATGFTFPTYPQLAPYTNTPFTAKYTPTQEQINSGKVSNTATASGAAPNGNIVTSKGGTFSLDSNTAASMDFKKIGVVNDVNSNGVLDYGETIAYQFIAKNTGSVTLYNVTVNDPKLANLNIAIDPPSATIEPGQTQIFTAVYMPTEQEILSGSVENSANATATTPLGEKYESATSDSLASSASPSLHVEKTGTFKDINGDGYAGAGDTIAYIVTISNTGNVTIDNVKPVDNGPTFNNKPATGNFLGFTPSSVTLRPTESQDFTSIYTLTQQDAENAAGIENGIRNVAGAFGTYGFKEVNVAPQESSGGNSQITIPKTANSERLTIIKKALLSKIDRGQRVPFTITVKNDTMLKSGKLNIIDTLPSGFKYVDGSASINGQKATPIINGNKISYQNITLEAQEEIVIGLQALALSSAKTGKHINRAGVYGISGQLLAGEALAEVEIMIDPVFDCGDIIGKVFDDQNRNGYQDEGESGLNAIRLATVNGELISSDKFGRFHIACAAVPDSRIGSNYILKLDTRSLPIGYTLTTENPRVVRLTAGKMSEINFGATSGQRIEIDISEDAFIKNSSSMVLDWQQGLEKLLPILAEKESSLFITYYANVSKNKHDSKLVRQRIKELQNSIQQKWQDKGAPYPLNIETIVEMAP